MDRCRDENDKLCTNESCRRHGCMGRRRQDVVDRDVVTPRAPESDEVVEE